MGENLHSIEVRHFLLFNHSILQVGLSILKKLLLFLELLNTLIDILDPDDGCLLLGSVGAAFEILSK
jgi:hypothetical protein